MAQHAQLDELAALEASLATNPYLVKYGDKLSELKKRDPATYRSRLALMLQQQARAAPPAPVAPVALAQGVDVAKLAALDAKAVGELWRARYSTSPGTVSAVIPGSIWRGMAARAAESPLFLYPMPQEDEWRLYVGQWRGLSLLVTPLSD